MAAIRTVKIGWIESAKSSQIIEAGSMMEIDNHADTTVLGRDVLVIHDFGCPVDVVGWNPKDGKSLECPTITGALAYDHPISGQTYILVYHQAIYCKSLQNNLMCPMQCRVNGIR